MEVKSDKSENFNLATILKDLEAAVSSASRVPLSNKVLVDGDAIVDCVDKIYAALPEELKEAQKVLEHSDKLLESVEGQSKRIISDAKAQAEALTAETEVYRIATQRAQDMLTKAEAASIELRHESIRYCDDVLRQLEDNIDKMLNSIRKNREDLKGFKYYDVSDMAPGQSEEEE